MNTKPSLGIYPGSFDPFHLGHLDIVKQAVNIFDSVLVAKGVNLAKANKIQERFPLPSNILATFHRDMDVKTTTYTTLLVDLIKQYEVEFNVTLVRGLRNGADLEYEQNIVAFLRGMYPKIKVAAFYCDPQYRHISSSALREIKAFSEQEYKKYVISDHD